MKKVTITLDFEGDDAEYIDAKSGGVDVGTLLRDALGEFVLKRSAFGVERYVAQRYAEADDRFRRFKTSDVAKRVAFAEVLGKALVTINVENAPPRRCRAVWVPGVMHPPGSKWPEVRTRCTLTADHTGLHSYEPEGECPEGGDHSFDDEEHDGSGTITCPKCGALKPEEE